MAATALQEDPPLTTNQEQSKHVQINYSYTLGYTWIDCGISRVNNLLSALGFTSSQQVSQFCSAANVFNLFAEDGWMSAYISQADRQLIQGEPRRGVLPLAPLFSTPTTSVFNVGNSNPNYDDFFQVLFTWLTHGQNAEYRKQFIEWWSSENGIATDPKLAFVGNRTPLNPQKVIQWSSPVLTTFKSAVDSFLQRSGGGNAGGANSFLPAGFTLPSGAIPYAIGQASIVRIPIPNTNGLCIEFRPRGFVPKGGSTSTLFFQDISGKRHLRLDYGYNVKSKTVDYHWNQKGTNANFGIADHTSVGATESAAYKAAKYFRYGGRVVMVVGIALDVVSVVQASKPLKRATEVVAGWAGAWAGCKVVGAGGAAVGTLASPLGTAVGGVGGCIIGGIGGYYLASTVAGEVYDWAEGTFFTPLPEVQKP